jgi:hypothetical protein
MNAKMVVATLGHLGCTCKWVFPPGQILRLLQQDAIRREPSANA